MLLNVWGHPSKQVPVTKGGGVAPTPPPCRATTTQKPHSADNLVFIVHFFEKQLHLRVVLKNEWEFRVITFPPLVSEEEKKSLGDKKQNSSSFMSLGRRAEEPFFQNNTRVF